MTKNTKNKLTIFALIIILIILVVIIFTVFVFNKDTDSQTEISNTVVSNESETLESVKKNVYGDYVNYPIDLDGDGKTTDDWKIFHKDEERVYLIATDYLKTDSELFDLEQIGMVKNGTYGSFWKKVPTKYEAEKVLVNSRCIGTLLNKENWKDFVVNKCADYAIGTPTLEMWTDSWNERYKTNIIEYDKNENGYYLGTNQKKPEYSKDLSGTNGYKDKLYYPHSTVYKACTGYWLATASSNKEYNIMRVTYNGMISEEDYTFNNNALRPVVALKTGITAELNEQTGIWEIIKKK